MIYVDTSVIVALLTLEPKTQCVAAWFAGLSGTPTCSDWLLTEFSSALSIKLRTGQIGLDVAEKVRSEFAVLAGGGLRIVPVSRDAFTRAAIMVEQYTNGLRAGDSLHLAVALEVGANQMATLDGTLAANAKRNGMELVEF